MYLLEKRPGPKGGVRYREVSAIWDVRYKEVLLYLRLGPECGALGRAKIAGARSAIR